MLRTSCIAPTSSRCAQAADQPLLRRRRRRARSPTGRRPARPSPCPSGRRCDSNRAVRLARVRAGRRRVARVLPGRGPHEQPEPVQEGVVVLDQPLRGGVRLTAVSGEPSAGSVAASARDPRGHLGRALGVEHAPDRPPRERHRTLRAGDAGVDGGEDGRSRPAGRRRAAAARTRALEDRADARRAAGSSACRSRSAHSMHSTCSPRTLHRWNRALAMSTAPRLVAVVDGPAQRREERLLLGGARGRTPPAGRRRRSPQPSRTASAAAQRTSPAMASPRRRRRRAAPRRTRGRSRASGSAPAPPSCSSSVSSDCSTRVASPRRTARACAPGDRDGGLGGERRRDDREPLEQVAVGRVQQLAAPVDHRPQARVPLGQPAQRVVEQREPVGQARQHVLDGHRPQPCGGELERERQVVQPVAQLERPLRRPSRRSPGRRGARASSSSRASASGSVAQAVHGLADEAERRPARRQHDTSGEATASRSPTTTAAASSTCSQLSSTSSPSRSCAASRSRSSGDEQRGARSAGPRARRSRPTRRSRRARWAAPRRVRADRPARPRAPSGPAATARRATSPASRVLPAPPVATTVTSADACRARPRTCGDVVVAADQRGRRRGARRAGRARRSAAGAARGAAPARQLAAQQREVRLRDDGRRVGAVAVGQLGAHPVDDLERLGVAALRGEHADEQGDERLVGRGAQREAAQVVDDVRRPRPSARPASACSVTTSASRRAVARRRSRSGTRREQRRGPRAPRSRARAASPARSAARALRQSSASASTTSIRSPSVGSR